MRGRLEGVCCGVAWGWAISRAAPDQPATLELLLDGQLLGRVDTTVVRADHTGAAASGHRCGFTFDLRPHLGVRQRGRLTLRDADGGVAFGGDGLAFDSAGGSGALDRSAGIDLVGWVTPHGPGRQAVEVEILIDGQGAGVVHADQPRADLQRAGALLLRTGFRFAVPAAWHDGLPHQATARVRATGVPLQDSAVEFRIQTRGHVDMFDTARVAGWLANMLAPEDPVRFDLWVDGERVRRSLVPGFKREDVQQGVMGAGINAGPIGFDIPLPEVLQPRPQGHSVELRVPDSGDLLLGPIHAIATTGVVRLLEDLAARLLGGPDATAEAADQVAARDAIANAISILRKRGAAPLLTAGIPDLPSQVPVDVIVPVYKGRDETLACLHSVLAAAADGPPMELIVIHDAGPDLVLATELRRMASDGCFRLLENERNLGFVATVNRGMRLHAGRDVVLLNSDTVVPRHWLERLRDAAMSAPNIASVTPLSTRATIFSLPRTCADNAMPAGMDVHAMDALAAARNAGVRVEVPTAMGFCMYLRRAALVDTGLFDEELWAQGYAEENDFSLRALARGWRHLAACDLFVEHHGSVSFGDEKPQRVLDNLAKLNAIYPDYPARVERFIEQDPIAPARGRINMALLQRLAPSWVLFVSHGLGGGTDTAINDLRRRHQQEGRQVLLLRSTPGGRIELMPLIEPHDTALVTEYGADVPVALLAAQLAELNISRVHFHHDLGFADDIWQLPALLGVPYEATLHDYFAICPRVTMIDASGQYCGEPEVAVCERCVAGKPALERVVRRQLTLAGGSVAAWRDFHASRLRAAERVVAPSRDASERLARHLDGVTVHAQPHPEAPAVSAARRGAPDRVAVIGAIGPHKGVDLLFDSATLALRLGLALRFVVIGYTSRDEDFAALDNVEITGRYDNDSLPRLLEASDCGQALFLSVWPETFSYTLSEAWRAGLQPVALDIGAQAERIRERGDGVLIPFPTTPRAVLHVLTLEAS
jgi:GT2 family glycosyltransferase/glycosyltransferase involved in cell wall biosynthesis